MKRYPLIDGRTREQIVWDAIKACPRRILFREIAAAVAPLDVSPVSVSKALRRLQTRGAIAKHSHSTKVSYSITGPRPRDRRGDHLDQWTPQTARKACAKRWHGIPFDASDRDVDALESAAGEFVHKKGERTSDPPPIPSLADLIAPR